MNCPKCNNSKTYVLESRDYEQGSMVKRRRLCKICKARFTTYECTEFYFAEKNSEETE